MISTDAAYAALGVGLSACGALFAAARARAGRSFYAADVYFMTRRSHRRFAGLSVAFGIGFGLAFIWPVIEVPLLAVYVLALVLYASSFARGFSGDDE